MFDASRSLRSSLFLVVHKYVYNSTTVVHALCVNPPTYEHVQLPQQQCVPTVYLHRIRQYLRFVNARSKYECVHSLYTCARPQTQSDRFSFDCMRAFSNNNYRRTRDGARVGGNTLVPDDIDDTVNAMPGTGA